MINEAIGFYFENDNGEISFIQESGDIDERGEELLAVDGFGAYCSFDLKKLGDSHIEVLNTLSISTYIGIEARIHDYKQLDEFGVTIGEMEMYGSLQEERRTC